MRLLLIICASVCFLIQSAAQSANKSKVNFIIMIDGKIPSQGDINLQIRFRNRQGESNVANVSYLPGDIELDKSQFEMLIDSAVQDVQLSIKYSEVVKKNVMSHSYKIKTDRNWFTQSFTVLRIYNLDKKDNKKLFYPLKGLDYTFEIDSPNGSVLRVRKK